MRRLNRLFLLAVCVVFMNASVCVAQSSQTGRQQAEDIAAQKRGDITAIITNPTTPDNIPGYSDDPVAQLGYTNQTLATPQNITLDSVSSSARQSVLTAPDPIKLDPTKYSSALDLQADPGAVFALGRTLSGSYAACESVLTDAKPTQTAYCDGWRTTGEANCTTRRVVEVDAEVTYRCERDSERIHVSCTDTLRRRCVRKGDCSAADIVLNTGHSSNAGDFPFAINPDNEAIFTLGHQQNSRWREDWHPSDATRDNVFTFRIRNKASLAAFRLTAVAYEDWLAVRVNGTPVYIGPLGGVAAGWIRAVRYHYTCVQSRDTPGGDTHCQRWGPSWHSNPQSHSSAQLGVLFEGSKLANVKSSLQREIRAYVDIDLLPYLKEGTNTIETRSIVGYSSSRSYTNYGEAWLDFTVLASCCLRWEDKWSEQCR